MTFSEERSYWSRRRFLSAAGTTAVGGATALLAGCGGGSGSKTTPSAVASNNAGSAAAQSPSGVRPQKGGIAHFGAADNTWDTFDADRSRFTPFGRLLGYTNLGLVQYQSFKNPKLEGAFASKWEQPDTQTLTFTLRDSLYWHDKPPVNGRQATVDDIVQFINRNKNGVLHDGKTDPNFYNQADYLAVDSVMATDSKTVTVHFTRPNPFFLGTLAGAFAKVQAPEAVKAFEGRYRELSADLIIGTGGYVLTAFDPSGNVELRRFDKFFTTAWFDGVTYVPNFTDPSQQQADFEGKAMDMISPPKPAIRADILGRLKGQIYDASYFAANAVGGAYYRGAPPWSDENLAGALFRAIDRLALIQALFQGDGALSGSIPPPQQAFAVDEKELVTLPGYLVDHDKDLADAKAMWQAGGGPALGRVLVDIPDIFEGLFAGASDIVLKMLNSTFGDQFDAKIEPYSTITKKISSKAYGNGNNNLWLGWIAAIDKLEPSTTLWNFYNSASPQFPTTGAFRVQAIDDLTNSLLYELDATKRIGICQDIDRQLIAHSGAGIPYYIDEFAHNLMWNYYHVGEVTTFPNSHQAATQDWFDQNDPTWKGRPA